MIRRGLQYSLLCSVLLLGAAPLRAQTYTRSNPPSFVTLSGVTVTGYNGTYQFIGPSSVSGGATMAKYDQTNGTRWVTLWEETPNGIYVGLHSADPGASHTANRVAFVSVLTAVNQWPTNSWGPFNNGYGGSGLLTLASVSPYQQAFPDWESAGVKIPLGFTFGMSVWAAFLAATIALKWVRDLASAAS